MRSTDILFLFSDTGGGHRSAAEALMEAVQLEFGDRYCCKMVDFLKDYTPWPLHKLPELYPKMVGKPKGWGIGYRLTNAPKRSRTLTGIGWAYAYRQARRLVRENPARLIVSIHPLANSAVLRTLGSERPPFVVVVTDLVTTHAFWYHRDADLTIVPTEQARESALKNGLKPDRVCALGLPVTERFSHPQGDPAVIRKRLGWPPNLPMVLLVGGGEGLGPLEQTALTIANAGLETGLAVVTGRNHSLKEKLESYDWSVPTFIYGFVHEMPDFMCASDILVSKAGPGTICEALNVGLPMVLYSKLPGQEDGNVSYIVEGGAGVWAPSPKEIVSALRCWLTDLTSYEAALNACRRLAKPSAAREIARILASYLD